MVPVPTRHHTQLLLLLQTCPHARRDRLQANPAEHPLMLAEPTLNTRELREKTVELAFEKLSPPAIFLARNAVLTSFAMGRQSSLVVDAGHEGTTGEPVLWRGGLHLLIGTCARPHDRGHPRLADTVCLTSIDRGEEIEHCYAIVNKDW